MNHLKLFVRIVERGGISAAARDLSVSQPTASRQLGELESHYGTKLLTRSTRGLRLTEIGGTIYEQVLQMLAHETQAFEAVTKESKSIEGAISVAAPSGVGSLLVAAFAATFVNAHPQVTVNLLLTDRFVNLGEEGVDVAIRVGRLEDSANFSKKIGYLKEVIVGSPALFASGNVPVTPDELAELEWVRFSGLRQGDLVKLSDGIKEVVIAVKPRLWIDQIVGLKTALLHGAGVSLIHEYSVAEEIAAGQLVQLLPTWSLPKWPIHAVFPSRMRARRINLFVDRLSDWLRTQKGVESTLPGVHVAAQTE